jgi:copper chaperone CopZ
VRIIGQQMPGVISVDASFIAGTATVTYDDSKITLEEIIKRYRNNSMHVLGKPEIIK